MGRIKKRCGSLCSICGNNCRYNTAYKLEDLCTTKDSDEYEEIHTHRRSHSHDIDREVGNLAGDIRDINDRLANVAGELQRVDNNRSRERHHSSHHSCDPCSDPASPIGSCRGSRSDRLGSLVGSDRSRRRSSRVESFVDSDRFRSSRSGHPVSSDRSLRESGHFGSLIDDDRSRRLSSRRSSRVEDLVEPDRYSSERDRSRRSHESRLYPDRYESDPCRHSRSHESRIGSDRYESNPGLVGGEEFEGSRRRSSDRPRSSEEFESSRGSRIHSSDDRRHNLGILDLRRGQTYITPGGAVIDWHDNVVTVCEPVRSSEDNELAIYDESRVVRESRFDFCEFCNRRSNCRRRGNNVWMVFDAPPDIRDGAGRVQDFVTRNAFFSLFDGTRIIMTSDGRGPVNGIRIILPGIGLNEDTLEGIDTERTTIYYNKGKKKYSDGRLSDVVGIRR